MKGTCFVRTQASVYTLLGGSMNWEIAGSTGEIVLKDVEIPAENMLGEEGEGFKIAMSCLDNGRYTVAAGAVGLTKAALDASVKYAHERETFGQEIGRHQLIQQKKSPRI